MIPLFRLRPPAHLEAELQWYFFSSASEMGLASNFWPLVKVAQYGGGSRDLSDGSTEDAMIARVGATTRHRRVHVALGKLSAKHQETLVAAYAERAMPANVANRLGRAAGVALLVPTARTAFRTDTGRQRVRDDTLVAWLASITTDPESEHLLSAIELQAHERLTEAYRAFEKVWK